MAQVIQAATPVAKRNPVSAAFLVSWFGQSADKSEVSRLAMLTATLVDSTGDEVKAACKGLTEGKKKGEAGYSVAQARASEIRTLFGAMHHAKFTPKAIGYHDAIKAAREALKSAGIKANGEKLLTETERAQKAAREAEAAAYKAALAERDARINKGEAVPEGFVEEAQAANADALMIEKASKLAASITTKYGRRFAQVLAASLSEAATVAQSQEAEAAKAA